MRENGKNSLFKQMIIKGIKFLNKIYIESVLCHTVAHFPEILTKIRISFIFPSRTNK